MEPLIFALETALPSYGGSQETFAQNIVKTLRLEGELATKCSKIFIRSGIETRYTVVDDFLKCPLQGALFGSDYPNKVPGTHARNEIYWKEAPKLSLAAAKKALDSWGGDPKEITHVICASCTGLMAPGLEFLLTDELGLSRNVIRLGVNNMGCFGAFSVLKVAKAFAQPNARILVVCTELCSLHFQATKTAEAFVSNALFSDGSAAAIVGSQPKGTEEPLLKIGQDHAMAFEASLDQMTWRTSDCGYLMTLSQEVPLSIKREIPSFIQRFDCAVPEVDWAIHPGGKAILHNIGMACGIKDTQLSASKKVLREYGNMSSPTFLFVLRELLKQGGKERIIGLGFGPGLSMEGLELRRV